MSKKYFFTFGSFKYFPYQNTYLVVIARNKSDACKGFRMKYPDRDPNHPSINCSGIYDEETWGKYVSKYYPNQEPVDIVFAPNCYGEAKDNYDDIYIYVPSGIYDEETWGKYVSKYYPNQEPVDIVFAPNCYGEAKDNYDDIYIYVPESNDKGYIIYISEGTGDNLLDEDIEEGYVDYINYQIYMFDNGIEEDDGGMIMLKELFRDKYSCTADCIPDVLEFIHDTKLIDCRILN